ncbi:class II aldolase/adducin family protein [Halothermothrix orenii]|uniref:L-fuculose phosphate aldolase n=1 Tax=Halothermothrix orenii (strain H 168 / OCM 544 / DSM 9562) TaxID=373903 RepID=B8CZ77_HALOH|nr:class II aldolase/adducin family protein [Halothermothrix orenii]ACL70596.1 L-fuculose phosphate aldolase [Halothermothrix orenii H 168]
MASYEKIVVSAGLEMCQRSLTVGTWGNISCRNPETGEIYLTPSGIDYKKIKQEDIVVFNRDGKVIRGDKKPSIENQLHLKIYEAREDVNAIIHTHAVYSGAFAITGEKIPPVSEDFVQIVGDSVRCADYALPGTKELALNAVKALGDRKAVLLLNHGTVCVGEDMDEAFKVCDVVEKTARLYIYSRFIGEPRLIPDDDIKAMQEFVKNSYGQDK